MSDYYLNKLITNPDNWNKVDLINKSQEKLKQNTKVINDFNFILKQHKDFSEFIEIYEFLNSKEITDLVNKMKGLKRECEKIKIKSLLNKETDDCNAYLEIHAGAGGTESQDWADMLRRMYMKWFDKKKFKYEIISEHKGEEAGIKSSTVKVDGEYLYGLLRAESGVHRLVRISPFDSGARRHTSFASVWVYPAIEDDINIEIDEKDLS